MGLISYSNYGCDVKEKSVKNGHSVHISMLLLNHNNKYRNVIISIIPLFLTLIFVMLCLSDQTDFIDTNKEYFRTFYSFMFSLNAYLCLLISVSLYKRKVFFHFVIYLIFFIVLSFLSLELFHWGQNVFHFKTFFFKAEDQLEHQFAFHELLRVRLLFGATFAFLCLYGSFSWILFFKNRKFKDSTTRLYVPDFPIALYFIPSVFFHIILFYTAYVVYNSHIDVAVIGDHSWLFKLLIVYQYFAKSLLSIGVFIFFRENFISIKTSTTIKDRGVKHNLRNLMIFSCLLISFILCAKFMDTTKYVYIGYGEYFELNHNLESAIYHYNALVKRNLDDAYVHRKLTLLYQRKGNTKLSVKHLTEFILKSLKINNSNKIVIVMIIYNKDGSVSKQYKILIKKKDNYEYVYQQLSILYEYLGYYKLVNKERLDEFICKSIAAHSSNIVVELFMRH